MSKYKVSRSDTKHGEYGYHDLIHGQAGNVRLWHNEAPNDAGEMHSNDYETLGYIISGKAELVLEGETIALEAGDSYLVPQGTQHTYRIVETLNAVEVTVPAQNQS